MISKDLNNNQSSWIKKYDFVIITTLIGICVAFALYVAFNYQLGYLDDNCHYMNLSKALYTGQGYTRLDLESHEKENTVAPGLPFIYSIVNSLGDNPKNLIGYKIFSNMSMWLFIMLIAIILYRYFKVNRWIVALAALYIALNPRIAFYASMGTTEAPFMALTMLNFITLLEFVRTDKKIYFIISLVLMIVTIFIKITAIPIIVVCFLWLLMMKKWRYALIYPGVISAIVAIWLVPLIVSGKWGYLSQFMPQHSNESTTFLSSLWSTYGMRFIEKMPVQLFKFIPDLVMPALFGKIYSLEPNSIGILLGILLLSFAFIALFDSRYRNETLLFVLFFSVYVGIYSILSSNGPRYMLVVIGALILSVLLGLRYVMKCIKINNRIKIPLIGLLSISSLFLVIPAAINHYNFTLKTRDEFFSDDPKFVYRIKGYRYQSEDKTAHYYDALSWCRDNVPSGSIIVGPQLRTGYFLTDLINIPPLYLIRDVQGDNLSERFFKALLDKNIEYIVQDNAYRVTLENAKPVIYEYANCFEKVFETEEPKSYVYKADTSLIKSYLSSDYDQTLEDEIKEVIFAASKDDSISLSTHRERNYGNAIRLKRYLKYMRRLYRENDYSKADSLIYAANILYPQNPRLWLYRGASLVETIPKCKMLSERDKCVKLAKTALDKALTFGADSSDYYNNYGVMYQHIRDYKSAIMIYHKTLELKPDEIQTIENLVRLYVHIGKKSEAIRIIESSLKVKSDPGFIEQVNYLRKYL